MKYVFILGAKSDIAKELAIKYVKNGYNLYLAARNCKELSFFSKDLAVRNNKKVELIEFDVLNFSVHNKVYNSLNPKPIGFVSVVGYLGKQKLAEKDFFETQTIINTNYLGPSSFINIVANDFEKRKKGFILGISSVAGDRGRKSNYIYGSSKSAFSSYLSGLRNRLYKSNVHVLTVKPGFVLTKMTMNLNLPKLLTAKPKDVAKDIFKAQQKRKDILYTSWYWRYVMYFIKKIPEFLFKKMSL